MFSEIDTAFFITKSNKASESLNTDSAKKKIPRQSRQNNKIAKTLYLLPKCRGI